VVLLTLRDVAGVVTNPVRRLPDIATGRRMGSAVAAVVAAGVAALGLSLVSVAVEPGSEASAGRAAGVGFSAALPVLFLAIWTVDAWIIDGVARVMGCPSRRHTYLTTSAYAVPVLCVFLGVRVVQAALDRGGGDAANVATAVGFVDFAVLAWFIGLLAVAIRAVYGLPTVSAIAAALAPSAVMATLLVVLLVVGTALRAAGVI